MAKAMPKTMARVTAIKSAVVLHRATVISTHAARVMEIVIHAARALVKADTSAVAQPITMETGIAVRRISGSIARARLSTRHKIAMKAAAPSHPSLVVDQSVGLKAPIIEWKGHAARSPARVTKATSALRTGERERRRCIHVAMATRVITIT